MGMAMGMGMGVSETTAHLGDEIGVLVYLGLEKNPISRGNLFFSFTFFRTKSFPNEENLDSSLLFFSLIIFIFIIITLPSHHLHLPLDTPWPPPFSPPPFPPLEFFHFHPVHMQLMLHLHLHLHDENEKEKREKNEKNHFLTLSTSVVKRDILLRGRGGR